MAKVLAKNLSKKHVKTFRSAIKYGMQNILSDMFFIKNKNSGNLRKDEFWALNDISFEFHAGKSLGIIGPNGSGKSTLLKLISGIYLPDIGHMEVVGRVAALIEVAAGFHPMLTGRENIYVNAAIHGMKKKQVDKIIDEIIAFAELEKFIDVPVKFYSSGMYVRLGFSIAAHVNPEILLVDEVLAVGDINFRRKCQARLNTYVKDGGSIILVSHDINVINNLCDECIVLDRGELIFHGKNAPAIEAYTNASLNSLAANMSRTAGQDDNKIHYGSGECEIMDIQCVNHTYAQGETDILMSASDVSVVITINNPKQFHELLVGFHITDMDGIHLLNVNKKIDLCNDANQYHKIAKIRFDFNNPLNVGTYWIGAGVKNPENNEFMDRYLNYKNIQVLSKDNKQGIELLNIPSQCSVIHVE